MQRTTHLSMTTKPLSLKARALRYLSMREHSRIELARKLARYAQEGDDIDALLDMLEAAQFLSETRFISSLVNRRATRFGNNRILQELQNHGIEVDALLELKTDLAQDEVIRAREVWRKRFGQSSNKIHVPNKFCNVNNVDDFDSTKDIHSMDNKADSGEYAKQRLKQIRFLQQRGFSHQAIQAVLNSQNDDGQINDG